MQMLHRLPGVVRLASQDRASDIAGQTCQFAAWRSAEYGFAHEVRLDICSYYVLIMIPYMSRIFPILIA